MAEVTEDIGRSWLACHHLLEELDPAIDPAALAGDHAEQMQRRDIVGLARAQLFTEPLRLFDPAALISVKGRIEQLIIDAGGHGADPRSAAGRRRRSSPSQGS